MNKLKTTPPLLLMQIERTAHTEAADSARAIHDLQTLLPRVFNAPGATFRVTSRGELNASESGQRLIAALHHAAPTLQRLSLLERRIAPVVQSAGDALARRSALLGLPTSIASVRGMEATYWVDLFNGALSDVRHESSSRAFVRRAAEADWGRRKNLLVLTEYFDERARGCPGGRLARIELATPNILCNASGLALLVEHYMCFLRSLRKSYGTFVNGWAWKVDRGAQVPFVHAALILRESGDEEFEAFLQAAANEWSNQVGPDGLLECTDHRGFTFRGSSTAACGLKLRGEMQTTARYLVLPDSLECWSAELQVPTWGFGKLLRPRNSAQRKAIAASRWERVVPGI